MRDILIVLMLAGAVGAAEDADQRIERLNRRVVQLHQDGNMSEAIALARKTMESARTELGPENPAYADSLNNLAALYKGSGQYAEAQRLFEQALEITRSTLGKEHPNYAHSLNNLAVIYRFMGRYDEAAQLYQKAMDIWRKTLGEEHSDYAVSLNNLAGLYCAMGRYTDAEPLYRRAIEIKLRAIGPDSPSYATGLNNLGELYRAMGRCSEAEPLYRKAMQIREKALGPHHPDCAVSANNLAVLYDTMGRHAEAEALYEKAMEIWPKTLGRDHPDLAAIMSNRALLCQVNGRYAEAEGFFTKALDIRKRALGEDHPDHLAGLNNLAALYESMGRFDKAEPLYGKVLEIKRRATGEDDPGYAAGLYNLGMLYASSRRPQQALRLVLQAFDIEARALSQVFAISAEGEKARFLRTIWPIIGSIHTLVALPLADDPGARREGLRTLLRTKAVPLEEMMGERKDMPANSAPEIAAKSRQLTQIYERLAVLTLTFPVGASLTAYRDEIRKLKKERDELEADIAGHNREFDLLRRMRNVTVEAVQSMLPPDAALVSFCCVPLVDFPGRKQLPPHYLAYVLGKSGADPILIDLGEAEQIDEAIDDFLAAVQDPLAEFHGPAQRLRDLVFTPVEKRMPRRPHLLISPDAQLNTVPFEALWNGEQFLLAQYRISYLDAGRDLLRFAEQRRPSETMALVADPDYDAGLRADASQTSVARFQPLSGARQEADVVGGLFESKGWTVRRHERADATAGALRQLKGPGVLHLATSCFFLDDQFTDALRKNADRPDVRSVPVFSVENPMLRSGLALAGANRGAEAAAGPQDGVMTALQLSELNLRGTELVVLSACDTGAGMARVGLTVCGLRRAITCAGGRSILMSLWKAEDQATRLLIQRFYTNWLGGMPKADALREAKQWLANLEGAAGASETAAKRESRAGPCAHPYYWAPFVLFGDWQ